MCNSAPYVGRTFCLFIPVKLNKWFVELLIHYYLYYCSLRLVRAKKTALMG